MKVARFSAGNGELAYGILDSDELVELAGDPLFQGYETTGKRVPLDEVKLVAPVIPRSKILGLARNYEGDPDGDFPLVFMKPNTAVTGPGAPIIVPEGVLNVQAEAELAVIIGRPGKNVPAEHWRDVVWGFTAANDVTSMNFSRNFDQWAWAKGIDTFSPLGPYVEILDEQTEWEGRSLELTVNGQVVQSGSTSGLTFGVPEQIEKLSSLFQLLPGDVILTGCPEGRRDLADGDVLKVSVEGIGVLENKVVAR